MVKPPARSAILNLSVEEENLAAIPFAILERRVGKRLSKIELRGTKMLPDGTPVNVVWQVQGNNDLGLPTEQDLDIFVALGVLTFRNNFSKTVTFTGREIAKILNIHSVHGKFYRRLKMAMDRFIPLRFRAIAATDQQEQVKWANVFQEASFVLDRTTGRCTGSVTWTDKLIQSMDSGFFRVMDARRYMELDGITAKHLYRFLVVAFEQTDLVLMDARKLATDHLGILSPPQYLSRLMQTLEPALDQLIRIQVVGSYHVVNPVEWKIALHRHPGYVPERKALLAPAAAQPLEVSRQHCARSLERAGFSAKAAVQYAEQAQNSLEFHALERAAYLLESLVNEEVLPHVAISIVRQALDSDPIHGEGCETLDWCEIGLEVCRQKKRLGQKLSNAPGLLIKLVKDPGFRRRFVTEAMEASMKQRFRQQEKTLQRQEEEAEERALILEYEVYRQQTAQRILAEMAEAQRESLRRGKAEELRQSERFAKIHPEEREREIDALLLQELAREQSAPYRRWLLRRKAEQAVLPLTPVE
jgi:hypothetical protein